MYAGSIPTPASKTPVFRQPADTHGFSSFGEFVRATGDARDTRPRNAMTEGSGSGGGFAVPPAYSQEFWQATFDQSDLLKLLRVVPMQGPQLSLPAWDDLTRSSTLGGLVGQWLGEGGTGTDQVGVLREVMLTAKKLACFFESQQRASSRHAEL